MSGTIVYPSLSSYAGALTDPKEVIPSLLRHMVATPATSSDTYESKSYTYKISLRRLMAEHGNSPNGFCNNLISTLSAAISRYYPDRFIQVDAWYKVINETTGLEEEPVAENVSFPRYVVYLDIHERYTDGTYSPVIYSDKMTLDKTTQTIDIKFSGKN